MKRAQIFLSHLLICVVLFQTYAASAAQEKSSSVWRSRIVKVAVVGGGLAYLLTLMAPVPHRQNKEIDVKREEKSRERERSRSLEEEKTRLAEGERERLREEARVKREFEEMQKRRSATRENFREQPRGMPDSRMPVQEGERLTPAYRPGEYRDAEGRTAKERAMEAPKESRQRPRGR